jgi:hypothetical protein
VCGRGRSITEKITMPAMPVSEGCCALGEEYYQRIGKEFHAASVGMVDGIEHEGAVRDALTPEPTVTAGGSARAIWCCGANSRSPAT